MKSFLTIIIFVTFVEINYGQDVTCDDPEIYDSCGNSCSNMCDDGQGRMCTQQCVSGCFCKEGYKRNNDTGKCVEENQCPVVCPMNEKYNECGNPCTEKCPNGEMQFCTLECIPGCSCIDGYKRNLDGVCVEEMKCTQYSKKCGKNEVWKYGNLCQQRCNKLGIFCSMDLTLGCYCKDGFLTDPKTGKCIPASQCPLFGDRLKCKITERYVLGSQCSEKCKSTKVCDKTKRYGCRCKNGLKRHPISKECVLPIFCPRCSGPYEVYKKDGNPCMDKCNKDVVRCQEAHKSGCYCIDEYARDLKTNICRPFPCTPCGDHATWKVCTSACDNQCDILYNGVVCNITYIKCPDACRCDEGYAREGDDNSPCIKEEDCKINDVRSLL